MIKVWLKIELVMNSDIFIKIMALKNQVFDTEIVNNLREVKVVDNIDTCKNRKFKMKKTIVILFGLSMT